MHVLIIGFSYQTLPGLLDAYYMYEIFKCRGYNIHVVSDIMSTDKYHINRLLSSTSECPAVEDMLSSTEYSTIHNKQQWNNFMSLHKDIKELFFYYSGHGVIDGMLLPSEEIVSWNFLYKFKTLKAVFDCCHPPHLHVPYVYNLRTRCWDIQHEYNMATAYLFGGNDITIISAPTLNGIATSARGGSPFTLAVLSLWNSSCHDIDNLLNFIKWEYHVNANAKIPMPQIYSSVFRPLLLGPLLPFDEKDFK